MSRPPVENAGNNQQHDLPELFLCEGKSAKYALEQVLTKRLQSVFAMQGKPPNALKHSTKRLLDNSQVAALIECLGCGYAADCRSADLNFSKIILLFDGDADGEHCAHLVITLFDTLFHDLLLSEKVVICRCPLYRYQAPDTEPRYFNNEYEKRRYLEKVGTGNAGTITRYKGLASLNRPALAALFGDSASRREKLVAPIQSIRTQE